MSNSRIVPLAVLLLSAVALVTVVTRSSTPEVHGAGQPAAAQPGLRVAPSDGGDVRELPSLAELTVTRGADVAALPPARVSMGAGADLSAPDASEAAVAGTSTPASAASLEELREFRAFVSSSLSEIRHEEAAARLLDLEQQAASMDRTIPQLAKRLELTALQAGKMESVLLSQIDVEAEYWRQWEQGADGEILGELKSRDRAAHIKELSKFLTPAQLETYLPR